jgi:hypothetical protein
MKSLNNLLKYGIIVILSLFLITGCSMQTLKRSTGTHSLRTQIAQTSAEYISIPQTSRTIIAPSSVGEVTLSTASSDITSGSTFVTELYLNSGTQNFAAYTFTITYNASVVAVNTGIGTKGIETGVDGFVSAVNTSTPGTIVVAGFDANGTGTGPGTNLSILRINWNALASGNASFQLNIAALVDSSTSTIGTPTATVESISIDSGDATSAFSQIEAENYDTQSGIQTEACDEGGENIGYIEDGDYIVFNNIDFGSGATGIQARAASDTSGGNIEIRLDGVNGTLVGTCSVSGTDGWQSWTTVSSSVNGAEGVHDLYLRFTGASGYLMNINWVQFGS